MTTLAGRIEAVRARIATAAEWTGRDPSDVRLVAVSKGVAASTIADAARLGVQEVGENRVQELVAKQEALATDAFAVRLTWHFVGVLQMNKIRTVVGRVALVHSVDSLRLGEAVSRRALAAGGVQDVLLEVNVAGESTKHGAAVERVVEIAEALACLEGTRLRGLMAIAPATAPPPRLRSLFGAMRTLRDAVIERVPGATELSMGMSRDFEIAVEEGATIVRLGTLVFGEREPPGGPEGSGFLGSDPRVP